MALNLPIEESIEIIRDIMEQLGVEAIIDGVSTRIMVSDLNRDYDRRSDHIKQTTVLKEVPIRRGSEVLFNDGNSAIVYTIPNDDIVSNSCKLLMCNGTLQKIERQTEYDENTGDVLGEQEILVAEYPAFIERKSGGETLIDAGISHEATAQAVVALSADISLGDRLEVQGKRFRVTDVDDMTELMVVGLASES